MAEKTCPMLRAPCAEHGCRWYVQLMGAHPQTGAQLAEWGCAVEWLPVLLVENAKETRQAAAAIESVRNAAREDARSQVAAVIELANAAAGGRVIATLEETGSPGEMLPPIETGGARSERDRSFGRSPRIGPAIGRPRN